MNLNEFVRNHIYRQEIRKTLYYLDILYRENDPNNHISKIFRHPTEYLKYINHLLHDRVYDTTSYYYYFHDVDIYNDKYQYEHPWRFPTFQ